MDNLEVIMLDSILFRGANYIVEIKKHMKAVITVPPQIDQGNIIILHNN